MMHSSLSNDLAALTGNASSTPTGNCTTSGSCVTGTCSTSGNVSNTPTSSIAINNPDTTTTSTCPPQSSTTITTSTCPINQNITINFATPVTTGNVLQEIRIVEARIFEIATVLARMDVNVGAVETAMVKRILDSIVADTGSGSSSCS